MKLNHEFYGLGDVRHIVDPLWWRATLDYARAAADAMLFLFYPFPYNSFVIDELGVNVDVTSCIFVICFGPAVRVETQGGKDVLFSLFTHL